VEVLIRRSDTLRRIGFGDGDRLPVARRDLDESGVFVDIGILDGELDLKNLWVVAAGVVAVDCGW
jgi:hypothetical protein